MRNSTTIRRRVAGYAKRKPKKAPAPSPPPANASATATFPSFPHARPPLRTGYAAGSNGTPAWRTYGVPLVLLAALSASIAYVAQLAPTSGTNTTTGSSGLSNSAVQDYRGKRSSSEEIPTGISRRPLPTEQSFVATPYRHPTQSTGSAARTNEGIFHSTATGRCLVSATTPEEIAAMVDRCLRRPN